MPYEWLPPNADHQRLHLWPYRSLPRRGMVWFIGATAALIAVPLLFTAFVLGWVRWVTGSIWPCIALHFVNNALGVAAAFVPGSPESVGLLAALAAAGVTVALGATLPRLSSASP